jgi:hypothetical protein
MTNDILQQLDDAERALTNHTPDDPLAKTTLDYNQFHAYAELRHNNAELIHNNIRALIDIARALVELRENAIIYGRTGHPGVLKAFVADIPTRCDIALSKLNGGGE